MNDISIPCESGLTEAIGRRLRTARMMRGLQQSELAQMAQVSRNTVIALERTGHGTLTSLVRVATALGLDHEVSALFKDSAAAASDSVHARQRMRRPRVVADATPAAT